MHACVAHNNAGEMRGANVHDALPHRRDGCTSVDRTLPRFLAGLVKTQPVFPAKADGWIMTKTPLQPGALCFTGLAGNPSTVYRPGWLAQAITPAAETLLAGAPAPTCQQHATSGGGCFSIWRFLAKRMQSTGRQWLSKRVVFACQTLFEWYVLFRLNSWLRGHYKNVVVGNNGPAAQTKIDISAKNLVINLQITYLSPFGYFINIVFQTTITRRILGFH